MKIARCPNCGGFNLVRSAKTTNANGPIGVRLLPKMPLAQFHVVVCKDCHLTRFFVRSVDAAGLNGPEWVPVENQPETLGLGRK